MGSGCWGSGCRYSPVLGLYQLPSELPGGPEPRHSHPGGGEPNRSSRPRASNRFVGMDKPPVGGPSVSCPTGVGTVNALIPNILAIRYRLKSGSFVAR